MKRCRFFKRCELFLPDAPTCTCDKSARMFPCGRYQRFLLEG